MSLPTTGRRKIVLCGAGFLASHIAHTLASSPKSQNLIQLVSRSPARLQNALLASPSFPMSALLDPIEADITRPATLGKAFEGASLVVLLVGLLNATPEQFERVQHLGARNVARAAHSAGASLLHFSAIGASPSSPLPYWRTKALAESSILSTLGEKATIFRPSLVFGPGDGFFARFERLARVLPVLPVFGGGGTKFQPVFVGDLGRAVEVVSRRESDRAVDEAVGGKMFEAGGPDVLTYRQLMELVLQYSGKKRPIVSLPYSLGKVQGALLEKLPENILTITQDQVEQLKYDNVVSPPKEGEMSFEQLLRRFSPHGETEGGGLTSVHAVLPTYLGK